jgi:hypothetical protein
MLIEVILLTILILALVLWVSWRQKYLDTETNEQIESRVTLKIAVPRNNQKSPLAAEQMFAALHGIGLNKSKSMDHFSLEMAAGSYGIHFICIVDKKYKTFFENQIYAQYPEAQITEISDYAETLDKTPGQIEIAELGLAKEFYLPIRTFTSFEVDPLASITGAISNLPPGQEVFIQILARPLADSWQKTGKAYVEKQRSKTDAEGKKVSLESGEAELIKLIETKNAKVGFQFKIRILAKTSDSLSSTRLINEVVAAFGQYRTAVFNSLAKPKGLKGWDKFKADINQRLTHLFLGKRLGDQLSILQKYKQRYLDEFTADIVNTEELASLYHLPNVSVETPNIAWARAKKLEYPLNVPTQDCRILGKTDYRGIHIPFGIREPDRMRHMYLIGKTGTGKSTFMEGLILADIYEGKGVGVIDPHGELIRHILEKIPAHRLNDVVLFDPADTAYPVGLNLIENKPGEDKSLIADGIVSVFKKEFKDSWGPRLEYILTNAVLTLVHCQNVSLLALPRLLSDDNYRKFLLKQLRDPILLKFWEEEYAQIAKDPRRKSEEISSILNKVGRFTTNPIIRNILGQVTSSIDIREIMDTKKIFLINISQGRIGEENMALLGGMLVTRLYAYATQRINIPNEKDRVPFFLYIDEFQNLSNPTFIKILSEARKFALSLTITHQFIDQIDEDIRNAIVGNVGTILNFAVGPRDAEYLAKEYAPYLEPEDLVNLERFQNVLKLSIDGAQSKPFTAITIKTDFPDTNLMEQITNASRENYARPADMVQQKLYKWASQEYNKEGNLIQKKPGEEEGKIKNHLPNGQAGKAKIKSEDEVTHQESPKQNPKDPLPEAK